MGDDYYLQSFLDHTILVARGDDTGWHTEAVKLTREQYEEMENKLTELDAESKRYLREKFLEYSEVNGKIDI